MTLQGKIHSTISLLYVPTVQGCTDWRHSTCEGQQQDTTTSRRWGIRIQHCPIAFRCPNPCQQHQEFPSGHPSNYCFGQMLLYLSIRMGTGASNNVGPNQKRFLKKTLVRTKYLIGSNFIPIDLLCRLMWASELLME